MYSAAPKLRCNGFETELFAILTKKYREFLRKTQKTLLTPRVFFVTLIKRLCVANGRIMR